MISPARVAAYEILVAVSAGHDLPAAIAAARTGLRDERDRALASEIATGVQRWRAALDHLIAAFAKRQIDRLDPEVVEILRLSAYQLLHLTRVPASAVVDDGANLVRRAGKRSAVGFVNAPRALPHSKDAAASASTDGSARPRGSAQLSQHHAVAPALARRPLV
jgi:16S rRNA (cytosine967-C5)-methyltransferase